MVTRADRWSTKGLRQALIERQRQRARLRFSAALARSSCRTVAKRRNLLRTTLDDDGLELSRMGRSELVL